MVPAATLTCRPVPNGHCAIMKPVRLDSIWIRKSYEQVEGLQLPEAFVTNEKDIDPISMPGTEGKWSTTRFVDPTDLRHDMQVNIVNLEPGAVIPFAETRVMEHGLYVLEGKAVYLLNRDWVKVEAGDYMWLRAFCLQTCYASGPGQFRYLLYKDVNRHMSLQPAGTLAQRRSPDARTSCSLIQLRV